MHPFRGNETALSIDLTVLSSHPSPKPRLCVGEKTASPLELMGDGGGEGNSARQKSNEKHWSQKTDFKPYVSLDTWFLRGHH